MSGLIVINISRHKRHCYIQHSIKKARAFTLVELLITVAIIAVLTSLTVPGYGAYVVRSKLSRATAQLSEVRLSLEQFRQENRTYLSGEICGVGMPENAQFTFSCLGADKTFLVTATSNDLQGLGSKGDYTYTINQDGGQLTLEYEDEYMGLAKNCWLIDGREC